MSKKRGDDFKVRVAEAGYRDVKNSLRAIEKCVNGGWRFDGEINLYPYNSYGQDGDGYIGICVDESNSRIILPFLTPYFQMQLLKYRTELIALGVDVSAIDKSLEEQWFLADKDEAEYCESCECSPCECEDYIFEDDDEDSCFEEEEEALVTP